MDEAYYNLAVVFSQMRRNDEAMTILKEAVEENPDFVAGHFGLGWIYMKTGDDETAKKEYEILKQKIEACRMSIEGYQIEIGYIMEDSNP